jgi:hypothetical protein
MPSYQVSYRTSSNERKFTAIHSYSVNKVFAIHLLYMFTASLTETNQSDATLRLNEAQAVEAYTNNALQLRVINIDSDEVSACYY